ncbi:MAG: proline iminopeptidase-family hydrolase [Chitinophagales bacterium]|nr:proline iminopeptidase-family hydrolase [Chitinophagales bacterium]
MKTWHFFLASVLLLAVGCQNSTKAPDGTDNNCDYLQYRTDDSIQAGGVHLVQLKEGYKVWTKRFGNNPNLKVLLLHGGPAITHEYLEAFESFFPQANIEFYEYDQLGSYYSDQPEDMKLWTMERFVEEVEQVRQALHLDSSNFVLYGQSWGGILAMEYALKYQKHLKGLVISNMTADFHKYAAYNGKLREQLPKEVIDTLNYYEQKQDYTHPRYVDLMNTAFYNKHICRAIPWPDGVQRAFKHMNAEVYVYMQGPSEFVPGGILKDWTVWDRLKELHVPTLTIGAKYDSMNPAEMEEMSKLVKNGQYLYCPNGSHLALWDDQQVYMEGLIKWLKALD